MNETETLKEALRRTMPYLGRLANGCEPSEIEQGEACDLWAAIREIVGEPTQQNYKDWGMTFRVETKRINPPAKE
jgi:hypothetical protein